MRRFGDWLRGLRRPKAAGQPAGKAEAERMERRMDDLHRRISPGKAGHGPTRPGRDPDTLIVGEIRDGPTADLAQRMAIQGKRVAGPGLGKAEEDGDGR